MVFISLLLALVAVFPNTLLASKPDVATTLCKPKASPKPHLTCGATGYVYQSTQYIDNITVSALHECLNICARRAAVNRRDYDNRYPDDVQTCAAFGYNRMTGLCAFYGVGAPHYRQLKIRKDQKSPLVIYQMLCFDCPNKCPQTYSEHKNLFSNGGFELSNKLIGPWHAFAQEISITTGYNSTRAVSMKGFISDGGNTYLEVDQLVNGCRHSVYTISFDLKLVNTTALGRHRDVGYVEVSSGSEYSLQRNYHVADLNKWQAFAYTFSHVHGDHDSLVDAVPSVSTGLELRVYKEDYDELQVLVDNAFLGIASQLYEVTGENLLENGDFESGSLAPWRANSDSGYVISSTVIQPGLTSNSSYAYYWDAAEQLDAYGEMIDYIASNTLSQHYTTLMGVKYQIRFEFRSRHLDYVYVSAGDNRWTVIEVDNPSRKYIKNQTISFSRVFTGSGKPEVLSIYLSNFDGGWGNGHEVWATIDDVEIKQLADQS